MDYYYVLRLSCIRGKAYLIAVMLVLGLRPAHAFSPRTLLCAVHRGASVCSQIPFVPPLWAEQSRRTHQPRVRMCAGEEEASDSSLPQMPSIKSVEFYADVLEDTESVSARSLGRVEEIGLFPLGMILNPGAIIPLHIFEMRYRQLFNQAWEGNTKVGIVMYDKDRNQWARVGTVCKIIDFKTQPDGRVQNLILCLYLCNISNLSRPQN